MNPSAGFALLPVEVHDRDGVVVVEWAGYCERESPRAPTWRRLETLPGEAGARRSSVLTLRGEEVVRGRLLWSDGSAAGDESVVYWSDRADELQGVSVAAAPDGAFCIVVGKGGRGRVGLPGIEQVLSHGADPLRDVAAGDVVDLRTSRTPLTFRLLDERGHPIEDYLVQACVPRRLARREPHHPGGISFEIREVLEQCPWLQFSFAGHTNRVFLVPAAWFAATTVMRDIRVEELVPVGTLAIVGSDGGTDGILPPGLHVTLTGEGVITGVTNGGSAPARWPWRIEGIAAGTYQYELLQLGSTAFRAKGSVTVAPGAVAQVRLPRQ